jgi:hypothetical protein
MDNNQLMAAIQPSQELQKVEWKLPVTGNENSFVLALSNPVIRKSTVEDIKQVLRYAMVKVGLREHNFPADEEKQILLAHIISEYGNHTPQEIQLAFDMAIAGRLDLEEKEISCYENFSCLYFSKIMNSYRKWAKEVFVQLKKDKPMVIENNAPLTDEEKAEWLMDWKIMDAVNIDLIPLTFYDFLDEKKLIKLTAKQKWEYTQKATTNVKTMLFDEIPVCKTNNAYIAYNKFCNQEETGFEGEFKGRILNRAKRLIVYDYLKDNLPCQ